MRTYAACSTFHMYSTVIGYHKKYSTMAELPTVANFSYCSKSSRMAGAPRPDGERPIEKKEKKKKGRKYKTKRSRPSYW
jgi:hypothetical protein